MILKVGVGADAKLSIEVGTSFLVGFNCHFH